MTYNTTALDAANNPLQMFIAVNDLTGGLLTILLLATLYVVIFIVAKKYDGDTKEVLLFDSLAMLVISILCWTGGILPAGLLVYPVILFFAAVIIYKLD